VNHGTILYILAEVGAGARQAAPAIVRHLQASDAGEKANAMYALYKIQPEAELVVTNAIPALGDSRPLVCVQAANALGFYRREAKQSVPALLQALQKWSAKSIPAGQIGLPPVDDPVEAVRDALLAIDPEAAAKAGVKDPR
jgi:hypothetical protein